MIRKETREKLDELYESDVYSIILFAIYKLQPIKEYSTLSELAYILDRKSLLNLLDYYGGKTITIPTREEFMNVLDALLLYQFVNCEHLTMNDALKKIEKNNSQLKIIMPTYKVVCDVLENYNFSRGDNV